MSLSTQHRETVADWQIWIRDGAKGAPPAHAVLHVFKCGNPECSQTMRCLAQPVELCATALQQERQHLDQWRKDVREARAADPLPHAKRVEIIRESLDLAQLADLVALVWMELDQTEWSGDTAAEISGVVEAFGLTVRSNDTATP